MKRALLAALAVLAFGGGARAQCFSCITTPVSTDAVNLTRVDGTGIRAQLGTIKSAIGTYTGTGSFVLQTSPAITTPTISSGVLTSPAVSGGTISSVAISGGTLSGAAISGSTIAGVTDGSAASAGIVGEYHCAQVTIGGSPAGCDSNVSTPVAMTSSTDTNITLLSLTAGNWTVCANAGATGATSITVFAAAVSTASGSRGTAPYGGAGMYLAASFLNGDELQSVGCTRLSTAGTSTVYLVANQTWSGGAGKGYGFLQAWRIR